MFHKNICQEQIKLSKLNAEKPVITQVKIHIKFICFKCINTYEVVNHVKTYIFLTVRV